MESRRWKSRLVLAALAFACAGVGLRAATPTLGLARTLKDDSPHTCNPPLPFSPTGMTCTLTLTITKAGNSFCVKGTTNCKNNENGETESCESEACELTGNTEVTLEPCAGMITTVAPAQGKKWKDVYANCDNLGAPVQTQGG